MLQVLIRDRKHLVPLIESHNEWKYILCKMCLSCLQLIASTASISTCLRFLEIYTSRSTFAAGDVVTRIYQYLMPRQYFGTVRVIIDSRVPPVMSETVRPPTAVAGEILQMILNPLTVANQSQVCAPLFVHLADI